jgi:hypothetical protein
MKPLVVKGLKGFFFTRDVEEKKYAFKKHIKMEYLLLY